MDPGIRDQGSFFRLTQNNDPSLLSIKTAIGVTVLHHTRGNANTVLIAGRILHTSGRPDTPSTINAVRTSNQIITGELEMAQRVDGPAGALGVLRSGLSTGGVSDYALTWFDLSRLC